MIASSSTTSKSSESLSSICFASPCRTIEGGGSTLIVAEVEVVEVEVSGVVGDGFDVVFFFLLYSCKLMVSRISVETSLTMGSRSESL